MNKQSQNQAVLHKLKYTGSVSRNWALRRLITRLASRIKNLSDAGLITIKDRGTGKHFGKRKEEWKNYYYSIVNVSVCEKEKKESKRQIPTKRT